MIQRNPAGRARLQAFYAYQADRFFLERLEAEVVRKLYIVSNLVFGDRKRAAPGSQGTELPRRSIWANETALDQRRRAGMRSAGSPRRSRPRPPCLRPPRLRCVDATTLPRP